MAHSGKNLFTDVILPLPLHGTYTYHVNSEHEQQLASGKRVIVQFGRKKFYTAIIYKIHHNQPQGYKTKPIHSVLDEKPVINDYQFKLWEWIAGYYMCSLGEVMKAALPSGLKLESETKVLYNIPENTQLPQLTDNENIVLEILEKENVLGLKDLSEKTGLKNMLQVVNSLMCKKLILVQEKLREAYKPKTETFISASFPPENQKQLEQIFNELRNAPKQLELLMAYIKLDQQAGKKENFSVKKDDLLKEAKADTNILKALVEKGYLNQQIIEVSRLKADSKEISEVKELNTAQSTSLFGIKTGFQSKDVVLLHGVTSSGKTEIYIHLIKEQINQGKQVLYLLPEIALTSQIIERLKAVFGNTVGIYHSKFPDNERVEVYNSLLNGTNSDINYNVILGVRSSVFLPFSNLGLIIVDEEHENTYKQFDPAPRYNARDTAIVLARNHGAKVLLGTATPAIESYYNAKTGKYTLVELNSRFQDIQLPQVIIADILKARRKKEMSSHFTPELMEAMQSAFDQDEQVILFQNRRGFAPFLECELCGWIPECKNCDVSLTYHKKFNHLVCHYCGYHQKIPQVCPSCGSNKIITRGFGTEKIEDEISILFPDRKIKRMDLDTTRSRNAYENIIQSFAAGNIDILVGTQMVSKGLDFDNVSVVGILNADNMLNFPDFRAFERSYQLMAQVSGRAGRKKKQGKVIIQTSKPSHPIIKNVIENDYTAMYQSQLEERKQFLYPPYYKIIKVLLKHKRPDKLESASNKLARELKTIFGYRVLGPQSPLVGRVQNHYLKHILIKIEKEKSLSASKKLIREAAAKISNQQDFKTLSIHFDVDPA
ncbi:MAG: primosomal protein N' [Bacteroidales bacterium]